MELGSDYVPENKRYKVFPYFLSEMDKALIEVHILLPRYGKSMGNAYARIAVVGKARRVRLAQGKHLVLELQDGTPRAHR